jgi:hypothetical protein
MSKQQNNRASSKPAAQAASGASSAKSAKASLGLVLFVLLALGGTAAFVLSRTKSQSGSVPTNSTAASPVNQTSALPVRPGAIPTNEPPTMEINQAVMVTVELDFGPKVPSIAEALTEIERRSQPDDGVGRTFAILDAYGEPTAGGKKLHVSMHVSSEKPGLGTLIFKRTGEVLWQNRIVVGTNATTFQGKNLLILLDNGAQRTFTVDGSQNPASILDASIKELGLPVNQFWPDGAEREVTYIYSSCGCPVKVMARRVGDRTVRTKDTPVIFPDDPAVVAVITRLMAW